MTGALAEAQLFVIAGLAFAWTVSCVVAALVRLGRSKLARIEPVARVRVLSVLAVSPVVLALVAAVACALPSLIALATDAGDHCDHHDGHPHLCPLHLPHHGSTLGWWILGGVALLVVARLSIALVEFARGAALVAALRENSSDEGGVVMLDTSAVFAVTVGLLSPTVLVSRGLEARLSDAEFRAVLAHERAHARRRDALRLALVRALSGLFPRVLAAPLLAELAVACEEICDREAAEAVGDPLIVADAIVEASRAVRDAPRLSMAVGFGGHATDRRVRRLLDPATERTRLGSGALALLALLVLALAEPLHHVTETFLGLLLY